MILSVLTWNQFQAVWGGTYRYQVQPVRFGSAPNSSLIWTNYDFVFDSNRTDRDTIGKGKGEVNLKKAINNDA